MEEAFKPQLTIEKGTKGLWGRVTINDNLIVDYADSLDTLIVNMKGLVKDLEDVDVEEFEVVYEY